MTDPLLFPRSVERSTADHRLTALRRRVSASGPMAIVLADLCYGSNHRDHAEALQFTTSARVTDAMGVR